MENRVFNIVGFQLSIVFCSLISIEASELRVLTWNVESGGSRASSIGERLSELQSSPEGPYDLIGLTEVLPSDPTTLLPSIESDGITYEAVISASGGSDRMMILFRKERFSFNESNFSEELTRHDGIDFPSGNLRRPLFVELQDKQNSHLELIFMVNHLARGNGEKRRLQARLLREWARDQDLPIIAVGDYNFDFDFNQLTGNRSMATFMRREARDGGDFIWKWIIPSSKIVTSGEGPTKNVHFLADFVDTNWSDRNEDRKDDFPDSILDFIYTANGAKDWDVESRIIAVDGDFPDDERTSDHRPVRAVFSNLPAGAGAPFHREVFHPFTAKNLLAEERDLARGVEALASTLPSTRVSTVDGLNRAKKRSLIEKKIKLLQAEIELLEMDLED